MRNSYWLIVWSAVIDCYAWISKYWESTTHSILGSSSSFEVISWVSVEPWELLSPSKLDSHVYVQVNIVFRTRKIVVSLIKLVRNSTQSLEHVCLFKHCVILQIGDGVNFTQKSCIVSVVIHPDNSMKGHFAILN